MKSYQNPLSLVLTKMKLLSSSLLPSLNHQRRRPSVRQSVWLLLMRVWRWCSWWRVARSRCYRMLDPRMIILPEILETENGGLTTAMEGFVVATEGSSHCFFCGWYVWWGQYCYLSGPRWSLWNLFAIRERGRILLDQVVRLLTAMTTMGVIISVNVYRTGPWIVNTSIQSPIPIRADGRVKISMRNEWGGLAHCN